MPGNERATWAPGRCETHPGNPAVGACDVCGRAVCLSCAVPVRGRILGPECLSEVLEPEEVPAAAPARVRTRHPGVALAGLGFVVALGASVFPWSDRFSSHQSGAFGGWGIHPLTWSLVAVGAAAIGLGAWAFLTLRRTTRRASFMALGALALLVAGGTALYTSFPPPFTRPRLGPWLSFAGSAVALAGSLWVAVRPTPSSRTGQ